MDAQTRLKLLLGEKDIQIVSLIAELEAAQKKIAELEKPKEEVNAAV